MRRSTVFTLASVWIILGCAVASAQQVELLSGERFERQLAQPFQVTWQHKPLRSALESLSKSQRVAIMLDRRVDPTSELNLAIRGGTLEQGIHALAAKMQLGVCLVDSVAYVGPTSTTNVLATVAAMREEEARSLRNAVGAKLLRSESTVWPRLSTPRDIIEELAQDTGVQVTGIEKVPHDLWPEISLPSLSVIEKLSLALAGFGLNFELTNQGRGIRIVPLPNTATYVKSYPVRTGGSQIARRLSQEHPQARVRSLSGRVQVTGDAEAHRAAMAMLKPRKPTRTKTNKPIQLNTFNVEDKKASVIVRYLAMQWKLQIEIDPAAMAKLEESLTLSIVDSTKDQVLEAVLKPLGLRHTLTDEKITISPK